MERVGRWLARLLLGLAALILLTMVLLTCFDVIGRYLLNAPINGKTELTRFMMAGLIACALPVIGATGGHISVDLLDRWFSARGAVVRDIMIDGLSASALGVLGYWLVFRADRLLSRGYVSDFLHLPLYPVAYFVAFMVFAACLTLILKLFVDLRDLRQRKDRPTDERLDL